MPASKLVRIKPYNPRRGYVLRRYSAAFGGKRYVFEVDAGWYEVPTEVADYLATLNSRIEEPDSPLAFDVKTREEAEAIDEREEFTESGRATADAPRRATRSAVGISDGKADEPRSRSMRAATEDEAEPEKPKRRSRRSSSRRS